MPLYSYKAADQLGKVRRGTMNASNELDLENRLKTIGLEIISASEKKETLSLLLSSVTMKDKIIMCIHLSQLERAGVALLDSIADLRDQAENPVLRNIMSDIHESVKNGKMLSQAMAEHPKVFNNVFTGLVKAGEKTGNLAIVFEHLENHLKWVNDINKKIKKAAYYPIFLLILMVTIIGVMMVFVIPKLATFLESQNIALPLYTTSLVAISKFVTHQWYLLVLMPIFVIIALKICARLFERIAYNIDKIKLNLPIFGDIIRKLELARFSHFFAMTFKSGIGVLECLEISKNAVNNLVMQESIAIVMSAVSEGASLTSALKKTQQFPSLVIRMFKVGEESGNLDQALETINFFYDREVNDTVNALIAFIQPTLTILMGGLMTWIILAVFGPIYSNFGNVGN